MSWSRIIDAGSGTINVGSNTVNFNAVGGVDRLFWRGRSERGVFVLQFTDISTGAPADPGFTNTNVFLQGKATGTNVWGNVYLGEDTSLGVEVDVRPTGSASILVGGVASTGGIGAPNYNVLYQGFPILPRFRWKIKNCTATTSVNYRAWYVL
jgi:hypothetical protein